jgi:hypothetical protein
MFFLSIRVHEWLPEFGNGGRKGKVETGWFLGTEVWLCRRNNFFVLQHSRITMIDND